MLTFERTFVETMTIRETGTPITNCKLYNIHQADNRVARFYSGDNYSFAETNEQKIRIDAQRKLFVRSAYNIFDQFTNEQIGYYRIPNGGVGGALATSNLYMLGGESYQWNENKQHRNMLKRRTQSYYRFDFISDNQSIVYYGEMIPGIWTGHLNPEQVFLGEIQTTDDQLLLPILLGIYIMEEKFRRIEQDPG